jgi:hypothetical protein
MLYPYTKDSVRGYERAFKRDAGPTEWDALDLIPRSPAEARIVAGLRDETARDKLLTRRIAAGECPFPNSARYLLQNYQLLASRKPKGRPLADFNRHWYEYLWPRDAAKMLAHLKLVSPRLLRWPRFSLDDAGLLPTDSCVAIETPTSAAARIQLTNLKEQLEAKVGSPVPARQLLLYVMAFLNSSASAFLLRVGREPTPKGSWNVNEQYLRLIKIPIPDTAIVQRLLTLADSCVQQTAAGQATSTEEAEIDDLVFQALGLTGSVAAREIAAWAAAERPD